MGLRTLQFHPPPEATCWAPGRDSQPATCGAEPGGHRTDPERPVADAQARLSQPLRSVTVTEERACSICFKRIGTAAFVAAQDGLLQVSLCRCAPSTLGLCRLPARRVYRDIDDPTGSTNQSQVVSMCHSTSAAASALRSRRRWHASRWRRRSRCLCCRAAMQAPGPAAAALTAQCEVIGSARGITTCAAGGVGPV